MTLRLNAPMRLGLGGRQRTADPDYYITSPGTAGNYLTVADSALTDAVTGDIDIRVHLKLTDWTPATNHDVVNKQGFSANGGFGFRVLATSGLLRFYWSTGAAEFESTSTAAPTVANGSRIWVRVALDVNNGASGNTTTFYTSADGETWTQLGSAVTKAGITSIGANNFVIGLMSFYTGANYVNGALDRVLILNGIGGTDALDVNPSADISTTGDPDDIDSFTATTGQTVTVLRSGSPALSIVRGTFS